MATLDATPLSTTANTYATLTEADLYINEKRLDTSGSWANTPAWTGFTVDDSGATLQVGDTSIVVADGAGTLDDFDVIKFAGHDTEYEVEAFSGTPLVLKSGLTAIPADDEAIIKVGDATKTRALLQATDMLDAYMDWEGAQATDTQALRHPRVGLFGRDDRPLASDVVVPEIKNAQCLLALEIIKRDRLSDPDLHGLGFVEGKADVLDVVVDKSMVLDFIPKYILATISHLGTLNPSANLRGGNINLKRR